MNAWVPPMPRSAVGPAGGCTVGVGVGVVGCGAGLCSLQGDPSLAADDDGNLQS